MYSRLWSVIAFFIINANIFMHFCLTCDQSFSSIHSAIRRRINQRNQNLLHRKKSLESFFCLKNALCETFRMPNAFPKISVVESPVSISLDNMLTKASRAWQNASSSSMVLCSTQELRVYLSFKSYWRQLLYGKYNRFACSSTMMDRRAINRKVEPSNFYRSIAFCIVSLFDNILHLCYFKHNTSFLDVIFSAFVLYCMIFYLASLICFWFAVTNQGDHTKTCISNFDNMS